MASAALEHAAPFGCVGSAARDLDLAALDALVVHLRTRERRDGRRHVGKHDVAGLPRAARHEQAGSVLPRTNAQHREPRLVVDRRSDHDDGVAFRIELLEQRAEEQVGSREGEGAEPLGPGVPHPLAERGGPPQVRRLDEDDRARRRAALEHVADHLRIERDAEGRVVLLPKDAGGDVTAGDHAVGVAHRERGFTVIALGGDEEVVAVSVRDDAPVDASFLERRAQRADRSTELAPLVLALELAPAQDDHVAARRPPRLACVLIGRGSAAKRLVALEREPRDGAERVGPRPRTERRVALPGLGVEAANAGRDVRGRTLDRGARGGSARWRCSRPPRSSRGRRTRARGAHPLAARPQRRRRGLARTRRPGSRLPSTG